MRWGRDFIIVIAIALLSYSAFGDVCAAPTSSGTNGSINTIPQTTQSYFLSTPHANEIAIRSDMITALDDQTLHVKPGTGNLLVQQLGANIQVKEYDGYIVELRDEPVLDKKGILEKEIDELENELHDIDTSGLLGWINIPGKYLKEQDLKSTKENYKKEISQHSKYLQTKQGKLKSRIRKVAGNASFSNGFRNSMNGFSVRNLSQEGLDQLLRDKDVKRVYHNLKVKTYLNESVGVIKPDFLHNLGYTGQSMKIAVIDTGIDYNHPDLGGCFGIGCKVEGGFDFVNQDYDPIDDHGHGTHCAATAAGTYGVAPGAILYSYKVMDQSGSGYSDDIIAAIDRAVDPNQDGDFSDHMDVISMSIGASCGMYTESCGPEDPQNKAVDRAVQAGVIAVIAAGNNGPFPETIGSPGTAKSAITVGAYCRPEQIGTLPECQAPVAAFSSRGPVNWQEGSLNKPDIIAPGVKICAALHGTKLLEMQGEECGEGKVSISGTSMATPHVAGAAALLKQANPDWSPIEIKAAMMMTAIDQGLDSVIQGAGLLDIEQAAKSSIVAIPSSIAFPRVIDTLPGDIDLIIKNLGDQAEPFDMTAECGVLDITPASGILGPGENTTVTVSMSDFPATSGQIVGRINITDDSSIPFSIWSGSELTVNVDSGTPESYFHIGIVDTEFKHVFSDFEGRNQVAFYVPAGEYIVSAVGDAIYYRELEYMLNGVVDVPPNSRVQATLDIADARPFTIKARALDNTELLLYQWQKAYRVYAYRLFDYGDYTVNKMCYLTYSFSDPQQGDRTVYIMDKPAADVDYDVYFKYNGVPFEGVAEDLAGSTSGSFSFEKCE